MINIFFNDLYIIRLDENSYGILSPNFTLSMMNFDTLK